MYTDTPSTSNNSLQVEADHSVAADIIQKSAAAWNDKAYRTKRIAELVPTLRRAIRAEETQSHATPGVACKAVAARIGVTSASLYNWIHHGVIPTSTSISLLQTYVERRLDENMEDTQGSSLAPDSGSCELEEGTASQPLLPTRPELTMPSADLLDVVIDDIVMKNIDLTYMDQQDKQKLNMLRAFRRLWYTPEGEPQTHSLENQLEFEKSIFDILIDMAVDSDLITFLAKAVLDKYRTARYTPRTPKGRMEDTL